jgi:hypothetical protein
MGIDTILFRKSSNHSISKEICMKLIKIMPCLDMKDGRVVKGIKFVNLKDAGVS